MDGERALTFTLETLRQENDRDHKEIIQKLNVICTTAAVNQSRVDRLETFQNEHEEDHKNDSRTMLGYFVGLIMLGIGVVADFVLRR